MPKGDFEFEKALKGENLSFICEVKKASPSKGVISEDFAYLQIAKEYESAGASAISCLTEPKWFMGSDKYLKEICENVSIPVLRKDFTVCDYQIYEARYMGLKQCFLFVQFLIRKLSAIISKFAILWAYPPWWKRIMKKR